MNSLVLLSAVLFSCPWTSRTVTYTYCEPVYYVPCTPTYVPCTPAAVPASPPVAQVVAENKKEEVVAENVSATETELDPLQATAAEEDEIVTDPAAFSYPAALSLGHMALDWGVATIGAGTLMPTTGILGLGGMGFPGGGNGGNPGNVVNDDVQPYIPGVVNQITIINNGCVVPPDPAPVPEPATIAIWILCLAFLVRFIRQHPTPIAIPATRQSR